MDNALASLSTPAQASSLRKGGYVLLGQRHACKIAEISTSKPGKHGHSKVKLMGYEIFTHRKYEDAYPAHAMVEVPIVTRNEFVLLDVDQNERFLSLFVKETGEVREDLKLPEGVLEMMLLDRFAKKGHHVVVIVLASMGKEMVIDVKAIATE